MVNFSIAILILKKKRKEKNIFNILGASYTFKNGKNANETQTKDWCSVWRCNVDEHIRVACGSFVLEVSYIFMPHSLQTSLSWYQIDILIDNEQHYTTWERANTLKISKISVENHLHKLGYINCFDVSST